MHSVISKRAAAEIISGATVQVIPHITDEIKDKICKVGRRCRCGDY
ncbi:MAG: hypothetical protein MZU91_05395 [Desulfosudis oleivorans]|nr:hypothetical protein [Desulfosudis oleivorans]